MYARGTASGRRKEEMRMRERDIERILVDEVRKLGGRAYKWVSPGNDGVPDRIVVLPGRAPVFVELKSETGKLTSLQEVQIRRLEELGQLVRVVRGIEGLSEFFQGLSRTFQDPRFEETSKALDCRYDL